MTTTSEPGDGTVHQLPKRVPGRALVDELERGIRELQEQNAGLWKEVKQRRREHGRSSETIGALRARCTLLVQQRNHKALINDDLTIELAGYRRTCGQLHNQIADLQDQVARLTADLDTQTAVATQADLAAADRADGGDRRG